MVGWLTRKVEFDLGRASGLKRKIWAVDSHCNVARRRKRVLTNIGALVEHNYLLAAVHYIAVRRQKPVTVIIDDEVTLGCATNESERRECF